MFKIFVRTFIFTAIFIGAYPVRADISSVGFVHATILDVKGINLPIAADVDVRSPNSVRYLMSQIDAANAVNGNTTNYADGADAVPNVMATTRVVADVTELIIDAPGEFTISPDMHTGEDFTIYISAKGEFSIDWGDGSPVEYITRTNTNLNSYTHYYSDAGTVTITLRGRATGYSTDENVAAIRFYPLTMEDENDYRDVSISGDLGKIFPILNTSSSGSPRFIGTFAGTYLPYNIPANLFAGVRGAPVSNMFKNTFWGSAIRQIPAGLFSGIKGAPTKGMFANTFSSSSDYYTGGTIPPGLFAGIRGAPAESMFEGTFNGCSAMTGSIPADLFSGISGRPAKSMFSGTFNGCQKLSGAIPSGLFGNISGAAAEKMFYATFSSCYNLTGAIPTGLFGNITGRPAAYMFASTFSGAVGLTGAIPAGLFGVLSGAPASSMFNSTFYGCAKLTGPVPAGLFGKISGAPAEWMFNSTFYNCRGLTGSIPAGLFGTLSGDLASNMFAATFYGCSGLTGIDDGIWDLSGTTNMVTWAFRGMFEGCGRITSSSPTIAAGSSTKLWQHFTAMSAYPYYQKAFTGCLGMSDYSSIPSTTWK